MFYVLLRADFYVSTFYKEPMRWAKKDNHHDHANVANIACICAEVSLS